MVRKKKPDFTKKKKPDLSVSAAYLGYFPGQSYEESESEEDEDDDEESMQDGLDFSESSSAPDVPLDFPGIREKNLPEGLLNPNSQASSGHIDWQSVAGDDESLMLPDIEGPYTIQEEHEDDQDLTEAEASFAEYSDDRDSTSYTDTEEEEEPYDESENKIGAESEPAPEPEPEPEPELEHESGSEPKSESESESQPDDEDGEENEGDDEDEVEKTTPNSNDLGYEDPDETFPNRKYLSSTQSLQKLGYGVGGGSSSFPTKGDLGYGNIEMDLGYEDPDEDESDKAISTGLKKKGSKRPKKTSNESCKSLKSNKSHRSSKSNKSSKKSSSTSLGYEDPDDHAFVSPGEYFSDEEKGYSFEDDEIQEDDEESSVQISESSLDSSEKIHALLGALLPKSWYSFVPTCSTVSRCITRRSPCFWFANNRVYRQRATTEKLIVTRLNVLCAIFTLVHMVGALWLIVVMLMPNIVERNLHESGIKATDGLEPNFWSINGTMFCIGILGLLIFIANMVSVRVIRNVNIVGAIRYLWIMLWAIPFEIFLVISLYDYYNVTEVWIQHWWDTPALAWFRNIFCSEGTSESLCVVPISDDEIGWCLREYGAANCTDIRENAQQDMLYVMQLFYTCNAGWGCFLILLMFLIVNTLEKIITKPIVQKSRESNVPAWLLVPITGCAIVGSVLRYSPSSLVSVRAGTQENSWVGVAYMFCTVLFLLAAALGWYISSWSILSSRDKRNKNVSLMIFIVLIVINSFILFVIFAASIYYAIDLSRYSIDEELRGPLACAADNARSCSNCNGPDILVVVPDHASQLVGNTESTDIGDVFNLSDYIVFETHHDRDDNNNNIFINNDNNNTITGNIMDNSTTAGIHNNITTTTTTTTNETAVVEYADVIVCPEWQLKDVTRVLQTQSKQSATLAGIFLLYAIAALRFGFILRKHLSMYQIDYI